MNRFDNLFSLASQSSGNAFVSGAGGLRLKSRAGQSGHSVANGSPPMQHLLKEDVLPRRIDAEIGPKNSLQVLA